MMKKTPAILVIGFSLYWSLSYSQTTDCKSKIQAIYAKFNQIGKTVPEGRRYYLDYAIVTQTRGAQNQAGKERIQVIMSPDGLMLTSAHMEVYENKQSAFMVLPVEKSVKWTKNTQNLGANVKAGLANKMMDSLFRYSTVLSCETILYKAKSCRKIVLQCTPRGEKLTNYKTVGFWTDEGYDKLLRVNILFGGQGDLQSADLEFNSIDFDYKGIIYPVDFEKNYIQNGRLSGKYQQYKLFDLRNKKR